MSNGLISEEPEIELSDDDIISSESIKYKALLFGNYELIVVSDEINGVNSTTLFVNDEYIYHCGEVLNFDREFALKALAKMGFILTKGEIRELDEEFDI